VAGHPLRPAIDRRLGEPLPHQLANRTRANPSAMKSFPAKAYTVLIQVSLSYSVPKGMFPRVTHPSATPPCEGVRLACVKPAASVRSEPGSNSQVVAQDLVPTSHNPGRTLARPSRRVPNTSVPPSQSRKRRDESENVTVGAVLSQRLSTPCRPSKASRKDPAVHVSLPSDEIVKQRGTRKYLDVPPLPKQRPDKTTTTPANLARS